MGDIEKMVQGQRTPAPAEHMKHNLKENESWSKSKDVKIAGGRVYSESTIVEDGFG